MLEHGVLFRCPRFQKEVEKLRKVPKTATKIIRGLEEMAYKRLTELVLFSLSERKLKGHYST